LKGSPDAYAHHQDIEQPSWNNREVPQLRGQNALLDHMAARVTPTGELRAP
jgi:hypothetical protein